MATKKVMDANFQSFIQSDKPVLMDFWAKWCGPCKMMAPVLEEVSDEYANQLIVGKLEVDENPETAFEYGIMSIPTLVLFQNGQVVKEIVGYRPKSELIPELQEVL